MCDWQMMEGAEEVFCDQAVALHQVLLLPLLLELVVKAETSKKPTAVDTAPRHRVRKTLSVA